MAAAGHLRLVLSLVSGEKTSVFSPLFCALIFDEPLREAVPSRLPDLSYAVLLMLFTRVTIGGANVVIGWILR